MNIDIILPYKEIFSPDKASAVSLTVKNALEFSEFKNTIKVYGQYTGNPFNQKNFVGLKVNKFFNFGKNKSILNKYLNSFYFNNNKTIIEIHNRPYLFNIASERLKNHPVSLHYHNDPTTMKGSKTIAQRKHIIKKASAIYFVSNFIKNKFLEDIKGNFENLYVLPNGIQRTLREMPNKKKEVLFVGRLVPEKGAHLFVKSIKNIVSKNPDWHFQIIGTAKAGQENLKTEYEKNVINDFLSLGNNASYLGFKPNKEVKNILQSASILVIPSLWDDPFPLTALEGLSLGLAIIASNRGGLTEMLKNKGLLIDNLNEKNLENSIIKLISNKDTLLKYQKKSWGDYIYNQSSISLYQDEIRKRTIKKYYK